MSIYIINLTSPSLAKTKTKSDFQSEERVVIEDTKQRTRIISSIHDSCHMGLNRTNDMLASKYYWPGMYKDVSSHVS